MAANLRRSILGRLVLVSVVLAALAGAAAFVLGRRAIDERILSLARDETRGLAGQFSAQPLDLDQARQRAMALLLADPVSDGRFVAFEVQDLSGNRLLEAVHPDYATVANLLGPGRGGPGPREPRVREWLSVAGASYVQVLSPLRRAGKTVAWVEGTFRVEPEVMRKLDRDLRWSVGLAVLMVVLTGLALYPVMLELNRSLLHLSDDLAYANMGMLAALGNAVARRDRGTNAHNYRVTIYSIHLARALGLAPAAIRGVIKGAFLHDVGKIGIADEILRKPGRLTVAETRLMRAHVRYGVEIVGKFEWLADAVDVIRCHHERVDGTGYPAGLVGDQIPISARIFTVVDVFDALTTRRPYKEPISFEESMRTLEEGRGTAFDPAVLDAFAEVATGLHRSLAGADELQVARLLDGLLVHYFPAPAGAKSRREPLKVAAPARTLTPAPVAAPGRPSPATLEYLSGTWTLELPIVNLEEADEIQPGSKPAAPRRPTPP
jgi:putative nucleotidyltransferase with HDIG domain